jgi:hypothetical protein
MALCVMLSWTVYLISPCAWLAAPAAARKGPALGGARLGDIRGRWRCRALAGAPFLQRAVFLGRESV